MAVTKVPDIQIKPPTDDPAEVQFLNAFAGAVSWDTMADLGLMGSAQINDEFVNVSGDTMTGHLTNDFGVTASAAPTASGHLTNKKYVDDSIAAASGSGGGGASADVTALDLRYVMLASAQSIIGEKDFSAALPTASTLPTGSAQLVNKAYVDAASAQAYTESEANALFLTLDAAASAYLALDDAASAYVTFPALASAHPSFAAMASAHPSFAAVASAYLRLTDAASAYVTFPALASAHPTFSAAASAFVNASGDSMTGALTMVGSSAETSIGFASAIGADIDAWLYRSETGVIRASGETKLQQPAAPTVGDDLTNKTYVDAASAQAYTEGEADAKFLQLTAAASAYLRLTDAASAYLSIPAAASAYVRLTALASAHPSFAAMASAHPTFAAMASAHPTFAAMASAHLSLNAAASAYVRLTALASAHPSFAAMASAHLSIAATASAYLRLTDAASAYVRKSGVSRVRKDAADQTFTSLGTFAKVVFEDTGTPPNDDAEGWWNEAGDYFVVPEDGSYQAACSLAWAAASTAGNVAVVIQHQNSGGTAIANIAVDTRQNLTSASNILYVGQTATRFEADANDRIQVLVYQQNVGSQNRNLLDDPNTWFSAWKNS